MRVRALLIVGSFIAVLSAPAVAQNATRSVEDYLCTFAGKCGAEAKPSTDDSIEAPDTKGMSLAKRKAPSSAPSVSGPARLPTVAVSPSRSIRQVGNVPAVQRNRAPQRVASNTSSRNVRKAPQAAARMDLRLSFLLNSAELTPQAKEEAKIFAKSLLMPELASKRFRIEGHTDSSGPRALNVSLSERRAAAVADYLSSMGVPRSRFEVRGLGPDQPLSGRAASSSDNRRVEALLL